jgi:LuxR family maltose regulon positive regulatory protein
VIKELGALLESGAFAKHVLFSVYASLFLAIAFKTAGRTREAMESIRAALDYALPDDLLMPFAENADLLGPVLERSMARYDREVARARLSSLSERVKSGREAVLREIRAGESVRLLTEREAETLGHMSAGLSTSGTAERMGVSVHTVRAHIKSASQKTGAKGRLALLKLYSMYHEKAVRPPR